MTTWCSKIFFSDKNWSWRIGPVKTLLLPLSSNRRAHFLEVLQLPIRFAQTVLHIHSVSQNIFFFRFVWKLVMSYPLFPSGSAIIFLFFESYSSFEIILSKYTGKNQVEIDSEFLKRYWLNKDLCIYYDLFKLFCIFLFLAVVSGNDRKLALGRQWKWFKIICIRFLQRL